LQKLFNRLRNAGLKVNLGKCEFGATNVNNLGYRLTPKRILPGLDILKAVRNSKPPTQSRKSDNSWASGIFFQSHV
jgi:hypothetical protein